MTDPDGRSRRATAVLRADLLAGAVLAAVTVVVVTTGHLFGLDARGIAVFAHVPESGPWHAAMLAVSWTASAPVGVVLLALAGAAASTRRRSWTPFLVAAAVAVLLIVAVLVVKDLVAAVRPVVPTMLHPQPSFPSGHSTTAVVVTGMALVLLGGSLTTAGRRTAAAAAGCYVLAVGLSRMYLHLHWFSDVLGGWLMGSVIVCSAALLLWSLPRSARAGGLQEAAAAPRPSAQPHDHHH